MLAQSLRQQPAAKPQPRASSQASHTADRSGMLVNAAAAYLPELTVVLRISTLCSWCSPGCRPDE